MEVKSPRPSSSLATNRPAEVMACLSLNAQGELRTEEDAVCPKSHTPNHKGTSGCSLYSLRLGPPCSPASLRMLSRPCFSKPPRKAANRLADKEENPTLTATRRSWI